MGIKVEHIFYTYNKKASNSTLALDDVSLTINDNDFVAIVGETGSGKSTLAQMFNALLVPDNGEVFHTKGNIFFHCFFEKLIFRELEH